MLALLAAFAISAEPALLRLGKDGSAVLRLECAVTPRLTTSAGRVEELRAAEGGEWTARLVPPADSRPVVAIVAAVCGGEAGFVPVPLWGHGMAAVRTRPNAVVEVAIGEKIFGPAKAGKDGLALVPVEVPPGVDAARQGARSIDLRVPRARTVQVVLGEERLAADRDREVPVWIFTTTRQGVPGSAGPLSAKVTRGVLSRLERVAEGIARARWMLPAGAPGEAFVEASVEGEPEPSRERLSLTAGAPASIALSADRLDFSAGEGSVTVRADVRDAAGNAFDGAVEVVAPGAVVSRDGLVASVAPDPNLHGRSALAVEARAGESRASIVVRLHPGPPASIAVEAPPSTRADGRTPLPLRVRVLDAFGNAAAAAPELAADRGVVATPKERGAVWETVYVPPLSREPATAAVTARAGGRSAVAQIALRPSGAPVDLAARAGVLTNARDLTAPVAGLEAAVHDQRLGPDLALALSLDTFAWSSRSQAVTTAGTRTLRSSLRFVIAGLGAALRRPISTRLQATASAGLGLSVATSSAEAISGAPLEGRGVAPTVLLGGGLEWRVRRAIVFADARWVGTRAFALRSLSGPLRAVALTAGCRLELF